MGIDRDLAGRKFGRLLAVKKITDEKKGIWHCLCDCGNEKDVSENNLLYGKTKSCGCLRSERRIKDISGQRFGKLLALNYTGIIKNHSAVWQCRCDCGTICRVKCGGLTGGTVRSCGCLRSEVRILDLTGKRFGRLTALKRTEKIKNRVRVWQCLCDCGNLCEAEVRSLRSGKTKSCGCLLEESRAATIKKTVRARSRYYVEGTDILQLKQSPRSRNTSGTVGVLYDCSTKSWKAKISFKGKKYYLGSSQDINIAVKLRKEAENRLHGEFLERYCSNQNTEDTEHASL